MALQFLDLVESMPASSAGPDQLWTPGDGNRWNRGRKPNAEYLRKLTEAVSLINAAAEGSKRAQVVLEEAMTTSDFPILFGDIIDRQLLANYNAAPASWSAYVRRAKVRDFRTVKRYAINGAEGVLSKVAQQEPYAGGSINDAVPYSYAVEKYGRRIPYAWEVLVNDDLGGLEDTPQRLGRAAVRTEEKFATQLFIDASGPHATLYSAGNKNIVSTTNGASSTNPALSIQGLQDAMTVLSRQVDADGEPIAIDSFVLVVPPALKIIAENILNATEIQVGGNGQAQGGGSTGQRMTTNNWMRGKVKLAVNYYIPIVASTANGNTSWFLFADPSDARPALEMGFLIGHEAPEVFVKAPNSMRVGGGMAGALDGDFDTDSVQYKVRHVLGGTRVDPKMTVGSNGSGS